MALSKVFDDPEQVVRALTEQQTICSAEVARAIAGIGQLRTYGKGDFIACQGDPGDELFYVLSGSVDIIINGHFYRKRSRNEMIGEMAVIQPGERRSADLVANCDQTQLLAVEASAFLQKADEEGRIWECIARELSRRLRQRDEMFVPPNPKPVVFIASSREGAYVLEKAEFYLRSSERVIRPWNRAGIFRPSLGTLEQLEKHAHEVDFAVVVVTTDDLRESRGKKALVPRDNVMFECGLFMGALERQRAFVLAEDDPDLDLPSDFKGVTVLFFKDDAELSDRLQEISDTIDRERQILRYCKVL